MNTLHLKTLTVATLMACATLTAGPALAQGGPAQYQKKAMDFMLAGKTAEALNELTTCVKIFGPRAKQLGVGDKFGWFLFQKGVCEMQANQFEEAAKSFDECYSKYPGDDNEFVKLALLRQGQCEFQLRNYDKSLALIEKFMRERRTTLNRNGQVTPSPESRTNLGEAYSLLARCYFLAEKPDIAKGADALSKCVENRYRGRGISEEYIARGFFALLDAGIKMNSPKDVLAFLRKYPAAISMSPVSLAPYTALLYKNANDCFSASKTAKRGDDVALENAYAQLGVALYALIPNTDDVVRESKRIKERLKPLPQIQDGVRVYNVAALTALEEEAAKLVENETPLDGYAIFSLTNQFNDAGSNLVSNVGYMLLEDKFVQMKTREDSHFYAINTYWNMGDVDAANKLNEEHMKLFPNTRYKAQLQTFTLASLLDKGMYEECLGASDNILETLKDQPQNGFYILASYAKPTALYHLDRKKEAIPLFREYLKSYAESNYAQRVLYSLESSLTSLYKWDEAIIACTEYVKKYPGIDNNPLMSNVRFDRAYCYINRDEGEGADRKQALQDCRYIIENIPSSQPYLNALVLAGTLCQQDKEEEEAAKYFEMAFGEAIKRDNKMLAAEANFNLMSNTAQKGEDDAKVMEYYDRFLKECTGEGIKPNFYGLQTLVLGFEKSIDNKNTRFEETRKNLQDIIVRYGNENTHDPSASDKVEQAVGSYTKHYLGGMKDQNKELTLDQIRDHFYRYPGVSDDDVTLRTVLRTAVIGVFQEQKANTKKEDTGTLATLDGNIKVLFDEIRRDFKPESLTSFTLLKLGNYLTNTPDPSSAVPYYDEILKRDKAYVKEATFGKAIAMGHSNNPEMIATAVKMMNDELLNASSSKNPDKKSVEDARYYLVKFNCNRKMYEEAIKAAQNFMQEYQDTKAKSKYKPEVQFLLGQAYKGAGKMDDAISTFLAIGATLKGNIAWSAPSYEEAMLGLWGRNRPATQGKSLAQGRKSSDRYVAWKVGADYVKVTKPFYEKMTVDDRMRWKKVEDLVSKYSGDGAVQRERREVAEFEAALRSAKGQK